MSMISTRRCLPALPYSARAWPMATPMAWLFCTSSAVRGRPPSWSGSAALSAGTPTLPCAPPSAPMAAAAACPAAAAASAGLPPCCACSIWRVASCIFLPAASSAAVSMDTLPCGVVMDTPAPPAPTMPWCGRNSALTAPITSPITMPATITTAV